MQWKDLLAQKDKSGNTEYKTIKAIEDNITLNLGSPFKVLDKNIKNRINQKKFVKLFRRISDTYLLILFILEKHSSGNLLQKISQNIINLKADIHIIMEIIEEEEFTIGDNNVKIVKSLINQMGNALESLFIWTKL
jgi:hypothetical protein